MKRRIKTKGKPRAFSPPSTGWEKFVFVSYLHFHDAALDQATCEDCQDHISGECAAAKDIFYCMVEKSKRLEFMTNTQGPVIWIKDHVRKSEM